MRNCVVGHVDRAVRQGLDHKLFVPRHSGAESKRTTAGPLFQPVDCFGERFFDSVVVGAEIVAADVVLDLLPPLLLAILQVPLVDPCNNALVPAPADDLLFWLRIDESLVCVHHLLAELELGLLDSHPFERARNHRTFVEAQLVADVVCLEEFLLVLLGLDSKLLAHVLGRDRLHLTINLDRDDRNQLEWLNPLSLHTMELPLRWLHEVHERRVVVWRVAGYAGDDARAFVHLDGEQRQQMRDRILARGHLHLATDEVLALNLAQELWLTPRQQDILKAHVPRGPLRADVHLAFLRRLETAVRSLR
mmetsp:Transcript_91457/g.238312  ORF Transcript_91457/g.238312 Transcript_91457/m.238312 type:complete len:306 (+) Transcript_91457:1831-2748(+)